MPTRRACRASWSELVCDSPLPEPLDALADEGHSRRSRCATSSRITASSRCSPGSPRASRAGAGRRRSTDPGRGPARAEDRPLALRDGHRRGRARPLDRRGRAPRAGSRSIPRPTGVDCVSAKLVGISLATDCGKACYIPLEHGGDDMFAGAARRSSAAELVLGTAEAVARGRGGAQDRAQSQIRLDRARPPRHLRRAVSTTPW